MADVGRRGVLGLVAGGAAALTGAGGRNVARAGGFYLPSQGMASSMDCAADYVESAARTLLRNRIDDARGAHERQMRRLGRLRSVSQAFVDAQYSGHHTLIEALYKQMSEHG